MAKLTKSSLKALIKECLVEILAEGLGDSVQNHLTEMRTAPRRQKRKPQPSPRQRHTSDLIKYEERVERNVAGLTEDPLMASIFKDTASTTLHEHVNADSQRVSHHAAIAANGDVAAKVISSADPADIFGEAADNWATLAFSGS